MLQLCALHAVAGQLRSAPIHLHETRFTSHAAQRDTGYNSSCLVKQSMVAAAIIQPSSSAFPPPNAIVKPSLIQSVMVSYNM